MNKNEGRNKCVVSVTAEGARIHQGHNSQLNAAEVQEENNNSQFFVIKATVAPKNENGHLLTLMSFQTFFNLWTKWL